MYSLKRHTLECLIDGFALMLWAACLPLDIAKNRTGWAAIDGAMVALFVLFVIADILRGVRGEVQL